MSPVQRAWRVEKRLTNKAIVTFFKSVRCMDCAQHYPEAAMDFDHVRGEKVSNVVAMTTASLDTLLNEIGKCDPVCSNCHRIRTAQRRAAETS